LDPPSHSLSFFFPHRSFLLFAVDILEWCRRFLHVVNRLAACLFVYDSLAPDHLLSSFKPAELHLPPSPSSRPSFSCSPHSFLIRLLFSLDHPLQRAGYSTTTCSAPAATSSFQLDPFDPPHPYAGSAFVPPPTPSGSEEPPFSRVTPHPAFPSLAPCFFFR